MCKNKKLHWCVVCCRRVLRTVLSPSRLWATCSLSSTCTWCQDKWPSSTNASHKVSASHHNHHVIVHILEHSGSGVELRTLDYEGFESCAAVLKPWASFFTLHCSSSLSCIHEYLAIDSGGYVYEQPLRINYSLWLDASQRSRDGVRLNRSGK